MMHRCNTYYTCIIFTEYREDHECVASIGTSAVVAMRVTVRHQTSDVSSCSVNKIVSYSESCVIFVCVFVCTHKEHIILVCGTSCQ